MNTNRHQSDKIQLRRAKLLLYKELLNCDNSYLLSEGGAADLNLMGVLARDKDIQTVLRVALQTKDTDTSK